jgi:predicted enzyme related to lactoylglutathione lyase
VARERGDPIGHVAAVGLAVGARGIAGSRYKKPRHERNQHMDFRIELLAVPVSDIDRAKAFYVDTIGFTADHDHTVSETLRFVQITPPGSACSIVLDKGMTSMAPGSLEGIQCVVEDADAALEHLTTAGVEARGVEDTPWGRFVYFTDPDGNGWALQELVEYVDVQPS